MRTYVIVVALLTLCATCQGHTNNPSPFDDWFNPIKMAEKIGKKVLDTAGQVAGGMKKGVFAIGEGVGKFGQSVGGFVDRFLRNDIDVQRVPRDTDDTSHPSLQDDLRRKHGDTFLPNDRDVKRVAREPDDTSHLSLQDAFRRMHGDTFLRNDIDAQRVARDTYDTSHLSLQDDLRRMHGDTFLRNDRDGQRVARDTYGTSHLSLQDDFRRMHGDTFLRNDIDAQRVARDTYGTSHLSLQDDFRRKHGDVPGVTFLPNGRVRFTWQGGSVPLTTTTALRDTVLDVLDSYTAPGYQLLLQDGRKLSWQQLVQVVRTSITKPSPDLLTPDEAAVWEVVLRFLPLAGLEITGLPAGAQAWQYLFTLLRQPPAPAASSDQSMFMIGVVRPDLSVVLHE